MNCYLHTLLRRLSILHPQMAIKKSSALSLLKQKLRSSLPFLYKASSSLLISSISTSTNLSNRSSLSKTVWILLVFIFFATKLDVFANTTKYFMENQDLPGFYNICGISRNQLKEMAAEKVLLVVPENHISTFPEEYQSSLSTLSSFINLVKEKQARMPKHFILNMKNEFNFHGPVGQFIEHADNVGSPTKDKEESKEVWKTRK